MTIKTLLQAAAFLSVAVAAVPASAQTVYTGHDIESNVQLDYSITTDGTLGNLDLSNIIASSITFTGLATGNSPHNFAPFTATNSLYFSSLTPGYGSGVSATATDLFFDFGGGGDLNIGAINCAAINVCDGANATQATSDPNLQGLVYAFASAHTNEYASVVYHNLDRHDQEEVLPTKELDDFVNDPVQSYLNSGTYTQVDATNQSFATAEVAAAPEPSTWSLMILGVGALGSAMRRQRRSMRASYAY